MLLTPPRFMWNNLADVATITATDATTGFPASNIQSAFRQLPWRSSGVSGTKNLTVDHGSAKEITCAIILDHNLTSAATATLRYSSDNVSYTTIDTFSVTREDEDGNTVVVDPLVIFFDSQNYRYTRIALADAGNSDGYISVGRVYLGTYTEMVRHFVNPLTHSATDLSVKLRAANGVCHVNAKPMYRWSVPEFAKAPTRQFYAIEKIYEAVGAYKPFFFSHYPSLTDHDRWTWYGKFASIPEITRKRATLWDFAFRLEEDL